MVHPFKGKGLITMFYSLLKLLIWSMPSRHKYKQTNWQRRRKHLVWMTILRRCCAVLLLMWDPSPACFLIFTSWSHSVNWEEQLITCYAATDSTDLMTMCHTNSPSLRWQNYFADTKILTKIHHCTWRGLSLWHIATMLSQNCKGLVNLRDKLHKRLHCERAAWAAAWFAPLAAAWVCLVRWHSAICCAGFRTKCGIETKMLVGITQDVTNLFYQWNALIGYPKCKIQHLVG